MIMQDNKNEKEKFMEKLRAKGLPESQIKATEKFYEDLQSANSIANDEKTILEELKTRRNMRIENQDDLDDFDDK